MLDQTIFCSLTLLTTRPQTFTQIHILGSIIKKGSLGRKIVCCQVLQKVLHFGCFIYFLILCAFCDFNFHAKSRCSIRSTNKAKIFSVIKVLPSNYPQQRPERSSQSIESSRSQSGSTPRVNSMLTRWRTVKASSQNFYFEIALVHNG